LRWAVLPTEHFSHNEDEYCSAKANRPRADTVRNSLLLLA
jgi:hypothetical protein